MLKARYLKDPHYEDFDKWNFISIMGDVGALTLGFGDDPSAALSADPPKEI